MDSWAQSVNKVKPGTQKQSGAQSRPNGLQPEAENVKPKEDAYSDTPSAPPCPTGKSSRALSLTLTMSTCAPPPDPLRCPVLAHSRLVRFSAKKTFSGRRQEPASRASAGFASKMPYPVPGHILDTACQEAPQEGPSSDDRNPATGPTAPPFQPHLAPLTAAPLRTPPLPHRPPFNRPALLAALAYTDRLSTRPLDGRTPAYP